LFGYIRIYKDELKVKEYNLFKAYYCGVCQAIKRDYGFPARYFLSYDAAFLAVLLSSVQETSPAVCTGRCMANPLLRRPMMSRDNVLHYSAAVNVLLVWFKLRDDLADSRSIKAALLLPLMYRKRKKAQKRYPDLYEGISKALEELSQIEKERSRMPDAPAAAFGRLMAGIFDTPLAGKDEVRRILSHAGFLLGRFIYLLDAWEDRKADQKKGAYNPFLLGEALDEKELQLSLDYTLSELANSLSLLQPMRNREIIENIVYLGLKNAQDSVFGGQYSKKEKRHERPI